jgi:ribonuclease HII
LWRHEEALYASGCRSVAGVDEVGRGPWAGPVVAAAVVLPRGWAPPGLDDSKRLLPAHRELLYAQVLFRAQAVGVGTTMPAEIDELGIAAASLEAMSRAVAALRGQADHLLIDAFSLPSWEGGQSPLVDGDCQSASVMAAAVVAKVLRDRWMCAWGAADPRYGFEHHKGYGTLEHARALVAHGPSQLHRRRWAPVRALLEGADVSYILSRSGTRVPLKVGTPS